MPRLRPGGIPRARLTDQLDRASRSALLVLSAPAGFGKTTLLAQWLTSRDAERRVGWLSLDAADNDPAVFWPYLFAAVDALAPGVGADLQPLLQSARTTEVALAEMLNELGVIEQELLLVLDDYHVISAREVHNGMAFLVEHLPPSLHLVIAGRTDPPFPLARLRARGELTEIRSTELRFTPEEVAAYLTGSMGLELTEADVETLAGRTEGWIAALQLAALSLQGRQDITGFIAGFAGDDRFIVDYLAEEVLDRQPEQVKAFLLQTSVLDRLSGPLCDAVTGQDGGRARLAALERGNLFLAPLDDHRHWYRYHQLFADVLRAHLQDERPGELPVLHRRASDWYEQHGEQAAAIGHALAAGDVERAADLVERSIPAMSQTRQEAAVRDWVRLLPNDVVAVRPVLSVGYAGALLSCGEFDGVADRLLEVEQWMDRAAAAGDGPAATAAAGMVIGDIDEFRRLPGMIGLYRAALALARGDLPGAISHARRARDLTTNTDHLARAAAAGLLGLAFWASGDLDAGYAAYADCMTGLHRAGHIADTFGCAIALGDIRLTQGRLDNALQIYAAALRDAAPPDGSALRGTADMMVGTSEVQLARGDLASAAAHLQRAQELGEQLGLPQNPYRRRVALARVRLAEGDLRAAADLFDQAEQRYVGDFFPDVRPIQAQRARLWITQGWWPAALDWAQQRGVTVLDELSYLREFEHITLARALLARHIAEPAERSGEAAAALLERLLPAAEAGGRMGSVLEVLVLQALTAQALGDQAAAIGHLERALALAEPEGNRRIFVDEGPPMAALLRAFAARRGDSGYARLLLAAIPAEGGDRPGAVPQRGQGLVAALSERELDVLRLLGSELSGPEIARRLFVSLNTVRTHTKSIYAKLGVNSRRAAVRRAGELGLS